MTEDGLEPGPCSWCGLDKESHEEDDDHEYEEESHLKTIERLTKIEDNHNNLMRLLKNWLYEYTTIGDSGQRVINKFYSQGFSSGRSVLDNLAEHINDYESKDKWPIHQPAESKKGQTSMQDFSLINLENAAETLLQKTPDGPPVSVDFGAFHDLQDALKAWRELRAWREQHARAVETSDNRIEKLKEEMRQRTMDIHQAILSHREDISALFRAHTSALETMQSQQSYTNDLFNTLLNKVRLRLEATTGQLKDAVEACPSTPSQT